MRELSLQEIEEVGGGFVFVIPPAVKAVAWAAGAIGAGVGAYYGSQHAEQLFG